MTAQYVDPEVSRRKFDGEIAEFAQCGAEYRKRGWFLVEAAFPHVIVVLAAPNIKPNVLVTGVRFDYSNYDAEPPSVRLVDPFSGEPYRGAELPTQLMRAMPAQRVQVAASPDVPALTLQQKVPLMQAHGPDEIPFLCLAGVREYHEHPAHTGDSWELHRVTGAGRLVRLLEIISRYGVEPIVGYEVNLTPVVSINFGQPPP